MSHPPLGYSETLPHLQVLGVNPRSNQLYHQKSLQVRVPKKRFVKKEKQEAAGHDTRHATAQLCQFSDLFLKRCHSKGKDKVKNS